MNEMIRNDTRWLAAWKPNRRQAMLIEKVTAFPYPAVSTAARELRIAEGLARRWNQNPAFREALEKAHTKEQNEAAAATRRDVQGLRKKAIKRLAASLQSGDPQVELRAALAILDRILAKPTEQAEQSGTVNVDHQHTIRLDTYTDEELRSLIRMADDMHDPPKAIEADTIPSD